MAAKKHPIATYLDSLGVTVEPEALAVPDVAALIHATENAWLWVDKRGDPVPEEAGLELYRVEDMDRQTTETIVRQKAAEGFRPMPPDAGFRMRGLHTPGKELVLFRTREQKAAYERAQRERAAAKRRGVQSGAHAVAGLPTGIETTTQLRDVEIPPLRE